MCGIAGIKSKNSIFKESIHKMLNAQKHRGPDNTGVYLDEEIVLGHNRLSIIDLHENANQPMISTCENYVLVFNGEIYNYIELRQELKNQYSFKTNSDTEVLLAGLILEGKSFLHKLNGMFAFAFWDKKQQKLFCARDRFGVKPFYFTTFNGDFIFASEIKTIHQLIEKKPNEKVWSNYLTTASYGIEQETFWKNVYQLPASHFLEYGKDGINIREWYNFADAVSKRQRASTLQDVEKEYTQLIQDALSLRFRADVPVGFNLSGGLDSSTLLALVNQIGGDVEKIKAFTFYCNDDRYDELPWVEGMLKQYHHPLEKVLLEVNEIPTIATYIQSIQDEPYGGIPTLAYSQIFKKAREQGVSVLLDGQGMDEAWAGYDYYTNNSGSVVQGIKKGSGPCKLDVLKSSVIENTEREVYQKPFDSDLLNLQYRDLFYTKIPRALRFNDRISMAYSTELREPFLDYRLVEYAFGLPEEFKIHEGQKKWMLRKLASKYLKSNITLAPKRPLQTPQREWLSDDLHEWVSDNIDKMLDSSMGNWFDKDKLISEKNNFFEGKNDNSFYIWQWISMGLLS